MYFGVQLVMFITCSLALDWYWQSSGWLAALWWFASVTAASVKTMGLLVVIHTDMWCNSMLNRHTLHNAVASYAALELTAVLIIMAHRVSGTSVDVFMLFFSRSWVHVSKTTHLMLTWENTTSQGWLLLALCSPSKSLLGVCCNNFSEPAKRLLNVH